ncbi:MAG: Cyclic di-GMP phosphodiesterase Gmr [Candidatus Accumulibacter regalis]|jgi:diguanylate cyclase (GGDEF)-like protein|uniref:Cyclic di-GMP phosphodiesterase Gmr n=1 Tax=Accumulibacter regalis TaxID=522306 RepID=A0A011QGX3_ACCRE|nr:MULTISPECIES: 7TM diverse intracellular signaling domain-containing protein [unclassified Candidatus Accumulibacter]EXI88547.1 MAG: Cyclic di-GMP phosphodiesterase Gmr [Candidatus Accumulibacter regalis]MQM32883.1 diguanylate cyclase [Candidatus Accumulibacter phosphatis]MBL8369164.1 diguanylate cyclase [Accumulibacter sp.]MBN8514916.1 diguanylate cyclase [Accumulibacter sp.]MBO3702194.1 diguanylate cyclase [Accumulibacter sp.]
MRALQAIILLLAILAALAPASADTQVRLTALSSSVPLRPFTEVLEDPAGELTLTDIERPETATRFRRHAGDGDLNFGYSPTTYWLRLTLAPELGAATRWLLEVGYPSLDSVTVFVRHGATVVRQHAGDQAPFSSRPFVHRNLVFPLELAPGSEQQLYLRVASSGSVTIPLTLWSPAALHASDQRVYSIMATYFGMLLALGLYNLLLYFSLREAAYLAYVGVVASIAVAQLSMLGLGNQFLWPDWPAWGDLAIPLGFCSTGFFGALFTRLFLETRKASPRFDRLLALLQAGFVLAAATAVFYGYRPAGMATALLGAAFAATAVATATLCAVRHQAGARLFLAAWSLLLLGAALTALRALNWLPTNLLTVFALQIGSALEILLLSFALADRINSARRALAAAQAETLSARENAVETLRQSEKLLEQRVMQRTLELAESNERLRHSEAELRKLAHHDPLTGLANRALLYDELRRIIARGKRSGDMFALLMVDLDGFKLVNDTHGHAIGDQLLETIAARLQECVRVSDTVARLGGDEFVVVVEGVLDEEQALAIGAKLIVTLSRPATVDTQVVQVGASVGVALWPLDSDDLDSLLLAADRAMYLAKEGGRGQCCLASATVGSAPDQKQNGE